MNDFCIYLSLPDYLKQWLAHQSETGIPVRFPKGSIENKILKLFLIPTPQGVVPQKAADGLLPVLIPYFRYKDPAVYNYLPKKATDSLVRIITDRFDINLWSDLHTFGFIGRKKEDLIYAWMEKHGIEPTATNWDAVAKRYQRRRNVYLDNLRKQKKL